MDTKKPMIAIVGPTASGKSELAVSIAKKVKGEIISCDSRQVYKGLDIGSGKVEGTWHESLTHGKKQKIYRYKNVPHHCIDFVNPKKQYSVAQFQKQARNAIEDIYKRGTVPILCGGTGHWVDAVVFNTVLPEVKPDIKLRKELESRSPEHLFKKLQELDPRRASEIDPHNKRRLIRALEIVLTTGKPVPVADNNSIYSPLWIGISLPQEELYKKIDGRIAQRIKEGMILEVKKLHKNGLSWKRLESLGLEYRFISLYLQKKISMDELITQLSYAIKHYSKRQMTWFKRNKEINWVSPKESLKLILEKF